MQTALPGRLLGGSSTPMAITAEAARDLRERWAAIAGNAALVAEIAKGTWRAGADGQQGDGTPGGELPVLSVMGDVGIVAVNGPLFKLSGGVDDMFRLFLGCTPYDWLWRAIEHCRERGLKGALLRVNSPGGDVGGVSEFADFVYSLRNKFKIWAYAETQCASAAQWIASQAECTVAEETALLGWIGVIRGPLLDDSKFLEEHGFKMTEVVSKHAKAKRTVPLDDEVIARFQVMADDLGDCFESAVARGRGVKPEEVAEKYGAGDGMIAGKALAAGLIDKIGSFNSTLAAFRKELASSSVSVAPATPATPTAARAKAPAPTAHRKQEKIMAKSKAGIRAEGGGEPEETKKGDAKRAEAEGKRAKADAKRADAKKSEAEADELDKEDKKDEAAAKRAEAKRCEAEADEMESKADMLESEADEMDAEHQEPDNDEGKKALAALSGLRANASLSAHTAAIEAKMVPRAKVTALETRVAAVEAERTAEKRAAEDERLSALADRAGSLGYFAGLKPEEAKVKRDRFIKIARNEPDAAEEIISSLPGARVAGRATSQGNPTGGRHSSTSRIDPFDQTASGSRRVSHGDVDTLEKGSPDLMGKARAYAAQNKVTIEEAMLAVVRTDPSLMR